MHVVVAGASGLLGSHAVHELLRGGHHVTALSRDPPRHSWPDAVHAIAWDTVSDVPVSSCDAVVNLAGESVIGRRWSAAQKERLRASRVDVNRRFAAWMAGLPPPSRPQALVTASAVGYYGARPTGKVTEVSPPGEDFLARLCAEWEAAAREAPGRVIVLRFGNVLAPDGGYLQELLPLAKVGLAGPLGGGQQGFPWVHVRDVARAVRWTVENPKAQGPYNVVAPQPARQRDLVAAVNEHVRVPNVVPVPALALRLRFGERAQAVLADQTVWPERLLAQGFRFDHTRLDAAVDAVLGRGQAAA